MQNTKPLSRARFAVNQKQRGVILLVMLAILVLGCAAVFVSSISVAAIKTERISHTASVLAQAKEALIGYAIKDPNRPGELPCPDIDNDGAATLLDYIGNNCRALVGRLPWKTLGLPDLRDAAGERLWYALSNPFHAHSPDALNSNTRGDITLSGNSHADNIIALVFAPGASLPQQNRSVANTNDAMHFLESVVTSPTAFRKATADEISGGNQTYNDQLLALTHEALFAPLERVIAHRVRDEIFNSARPFWQPYPRAANFAAPMSPNAFISAKTELSEGLLPTNTVWADLPAINFDGGSATTACEFLNGTNALSNAIFRCTFSNISGTPFITLNATLTPSLGLWREYKLTSSNEVRIRIKSESCTAPNTAATTTHDCAASKVPGLNANIAYLKNADGSVQVTFSGTLIPAITRIELRDVVNDADFDWFTQNEWNKVMYYATSPSKNHATLIMAGAARAGQSRPSGNLADYFEAENSIPFDDIFTNAKRSEQFNDYVIETTP